MPVRAMVRSGSKVGVSNRHANDHYWDFLETTLSVPESPPFVPMPPPTIPELFYFSTNQVFTGAMDSCWLFHSA